MKSVRQNGLGMRYVLPAAWSTVLALLLHDSPVLAQTLMTRVDIKPVLSVADAPTWRSVHVANAAILTPSESPDGRWRMFIRGSGFFPEEGGDPRDHYHDSIGLLYQESETFSPRGPWKEFPGNPILVHGERTAYDGKHLLDCTPVWGTVPDGQNALVMFYKGVSYEHGACLAAAYSTDLGRSFEKLSRNPLQSFIGPCDAIFHEGLFYVFYGDMKYDTAKRKPTDKLKTYLAITPDPAKFAETPRRLVLDTGPEGSFDSMSVHGGRVFRIANRWYMVYQCSRRHIDYPDRFHVAWSDDLVTWTKVTNEQPFFQRGPSGAWDEGGIWFGEVFEHDGSLYMYYEGWGSGKPGYDRRRPYQPGGRSQTGLASVSVDTFLRWCGQP
ncbi:hypothetical protein Pan14r_37100 [Crateriforma conspicua]|uniref:Glycosyl hydrolases family 43 n=2 Tax=Crateriforma conspicua TaxID=2527996 RepID=A0A5C5Y7V8_9PLAN|nr:hypothetical protein Pan14r_37100 [Crateriforma conspicua]